MLSIPKIALVGCPNCGKSTLFNVLTSNHQETANYPGVTVDSKIGSLITPQGKTVNLLDLPGTYSLNGHSPDEIITRDNILGLFDNEIAPVALICVADATNMRMIFRLILELQAINRPLILAINMTDIAKRHGYNIDINRLSIELGIPVIPIIAVRKVGITSLLTEIDRLIESNLTNTFDRIIWEKPTNQEIRNSYKKATYIFNTCIFSSNDKYLTMQIDRILLHPVFGIVILLGSFFFIFQAVFTWSALLINGIKTIFNLIITQIQCMMLDCLLRSLIIDGLIAGVGNVVVFLPQILILFLFIILLEDTGYMARVAFILDRLMGSVGLNGRSFIPLLSSFACTIPGMLATRTIKNQKDRLTTILIAPLMTCSARIPVYTMIISTFVPQKNFIGIFSLQGLIMFALYAIGIIFALIVALIMKRLIWHQTSEPFLMEMPNYKCPQFKKIALNLWYRATIFLLHIGKTILVTMILIWFLSSFPSAPQNATEPSINYSIIGMIGHLIHPIFAPIGFSWQITVALIFGIVAREVVIGALGTIYALDITSKNIDTTLQSILATYWSLPTAFALLAWYVFAPQCISTIAMIKHETHSLRWPIFLFIYTFVLAYMAAFLTFHITTLIIK